MKKLVFVLVASFCSAAFALTAKVVSVSGKVEMQEGGMWVPLVSGDQVEKNAVISTGFKSEATFEVKGSRFKLGPLTRATIEDLMESDEIDSTSIFLSSGKVSASVNGADGKRVGFKVKSAIATASVRGTEFECTASGRLCVEKGIVSFYKVDSKSERGVNVCAGQESKIADAVASVSSPQEEKRLVSQGAENSTTSLSSAEGVGGTADSSVGNSGTKNVVTSGRVNVQLKFD